MSSNGNGGFRPFCSVVVCTHNRPEQLGWCLKALSTVSYPIFEVVVVDSAPVGDDAELLARQWGARYVREPIPGASRARNLGAAEARGEIVAYVDDDALPESAWLSGLVDEFRDPNVMAAAGRTMAPEANREVKALCSLIQGPGTSLDKLAIDRNHPQWLEISGFGGIGNGMNMAFRRRAFDVWPGFDLRLGPGTPFGGCEEQHAFLSLVNLGYQVRYTPAAVVRHPTRFTEEALRARYWQECSKSAAYALFLFCDEPQYRKPLLKYAGEALRGKRREWRPPLRDLPRSYARWRVMLAWLRGTLIFWRFRAHGSGNSMPVFGPARLEHVAVSQPVVSVALDPLQNVGQTER